MAAISLSQLDIISAFLEKSRDYLDIEHSIRLSWPRLAGRLPLSPGTAQAPRGCSGAGTRKPGCQRQRQGDMAGLATP
jgi:hypothetical protein